MKLVLQKVTSAIVKVNDEIVASIGQGVCVYVGFAKDDELSEVETFAKKIPKIRIYDNEENNRRWDRSVQDMKYEILCIPQYGLCAGLNATRLNFHNAMENEKSKEFYDHFLQIMRQTYNFDQVKDGIFGIKRKMIIENEGPMTIILDKSKATK